jgi:hypothetical protein
MGSAIAFVMNAGLLPALPVKLGQSISEAYCMQPVLIPDNSLLLLWSTCNVRWMTQLGRAQ